MKTNEHTQKATQSNFITIIFCATCKSIVISMTMDIN